MRKRTPTPRRRCPFIQCPSHRRYRSPGVVRHGFIHTKTGASRVRLLCRTCKRTFSSRRGSAYYRLQHPRRTFDQFASMMSEGLSCAALARSLDVCPGTVSRWLMRAGKHARAFSDAHDRVDEPVELQLDELAARRADNRSSPWVYNSIEVWSRFWPAAYVGRRTRRSTRAFVDQARSGLGKIPRNVLITSDPYPYYERELNRSFGPTCVYVQVKNAYSPHNVLRTSSTVVIGSEERFESMFARSEDSKKPNTSYIERLNLFLRRSCSYLHRRTSGPVRNPARLASAVEIVRCSYNYLRPHAALRFGKEVRTPAMQAGSFSRRLTWREVFNWPVRPDLQRSLTPAQYPRSPRGQSHTSSHILAADSRVTDA